MLKLNKINYNIKFINIRNNKIIIIIIYIL